MHDPLEGVTEHGTIVTGVGRGRVPAAFEPVLEAVVTAIRSTDVSVYVYGSVATGMARVGDSDVDMLTVGLTPDNASSIGRDLSERFKDVCRAVEIAAARASDFEGDTDEAYGGRVFLRHYCLHVAGPDLHAPLPQYPADIRAARGFNGDITRHLEMWRQQLSESCHPTDLGRRVARKSLLAVAGLVSVHDATWTTDRETAAARWAKVNPSLASDLQTLVDWSSGDRRAGEQEVAEAIDGIAMEIATSFAATIGLWG